MTRNISVVLIALLMFSCAQKKEFVFPEEGIEIAKVISGVKVNFKMLVEIR